MAANFSKSKWVWCIIIALIIIIGLFIRVQFFFANQIINTDGIYYTNIAQNLYDGNGYVSDFLEWIAGPDKLPYSMNDYPPVFPFVIILSYLVIGKWFIAGKIVSFLFGLFIPLLIYILTKLLYDKKTGIIASLICIPLLDLIIYTAEVRSEVIYAFFLIITLIFFYKALLTRLQRFFILTAIFTGVLILIKFQAIVIPFLLVSYYYIYNYNKRKNLKHVLIFIFIVFIIVLPWTLRIIGQGNESNFPDQFIVQWFTLENMEVYEKVAHSLTPYDFVLEYFSGNKLIIAKNLFMKFITTLFQYIYEHIILFVFFILGFNCAKKNIRKNLILVLIILFHLILPFVDYECFSRHFFPGLILAMPIIANGFVRLLNPFKQKPLKLLVPAFFIFYLIVMSLNSLSHIPRYSSDDKENIFFNDNYNFLRNLAQNESIISSPYPEDAYFTNKRWVNLPYEPLDISIDFLKRFNISYFVVYDDDYITLHPDFEDLLYRDVTYARVRQIHKTEVYKDKNQTVKIYQITH